MIWLVLAVFLAARLPALLSAAPLGDEYMQAYFALGKPALGAFLSEIRHNPHHVLLDPLSTWLFARAGGELAWLRIPSLLWGLAGLEGLRRLGAHAGGSRLGLMAAAALAVSAMHAEWSVRADFYAAAAALAVWQSLFLVELEKKPRDWGAYGLCAAAFLHAHPHSVLVAAIHGLWLAAPKRRAALKGWALAWACAGAIFLPWFLYSTRSAVRLDGLAFWSAGPEGVAAFLSSLPLHFTSLSEAAPGETGPLRGALAAFVLALWTLSRLPGRRRLEAPELSLSRLLVPAGLLLVLATDWAFGMYLAPRQLVWLLPFFLLEAAAGAQRLGAALPVPVARMGGLALLIVAFALRLGGQRAQIEAGAGLARVTSSVARACLPGDALVFDDDLAAHAFLYRFDRRAFAAAPAFRELPEGFSARCAGGEAAVTAGEAPKGRPAWRVRGTIEDFTIEPPPGRAS